MRKKKTNQLWRRSWFVVAGERVKVHNTSVAEKKREERAAKSKNEGKKEGMTRNKINK